jgi:hypothetical protein
MELWIEKQKYSNGVTILCKIGNRVLKSYFSNPSKNIDSADLEYIKARYPIIRTEKRAIKFKEKYKELFKCQE